MKLLRFRSRTLGMLLAILAAVFVASALRPVTETGYYQISGNLVIYDDGGPRMWLAQRPPTIAEWAARATCCVAAIAIACSLAAAVRTWFPAQHRSHLPTQR